MQVISNELFDKLTNMAQQDPELKEMLFESNQKTRNHKAFLSNGLRDLEIELYSDLENHLKELSSEDLEDKDLIKNSDEVDSIVSSLIPTNNESLGELMLDLKSINLVAEPSGEGEDLYKTIEIAVYQYLKDFANKQIDGYEFEED